MDNNVQIFSLLEFKHHLFMSHIVSSVRLLKERIFVFMCNLIFLVWLVFLLFPTSSIFLKTVFPKTCFVFPIFVGGEACF